MGATALSLQDFTSIFEIFTGYYLLLGLNKSVSDYFNISGPFRSDSENYESIVNIETTANKFEQEALAEIDSSRPVTKTRKERKMQLLWERKKVNELDKTMEPFERFTEMGKWYGRLVKSHFGYNEQGSAPDKVSETEFFAFIRPFYIYYGLMAITVLILSGMYKAWDRIHVLSVVNCISFAIGLFLLTKAVLITIRKPKKISLINPIFALLFSLFFFISILSIPCRIYDKMLIPFPIDHLISYEDFHVSFSVLIILFPIIVHIICLMIVAYTQKQYVKLKERLPIELRTPAATVPTSQPGSLPDVSL